MKKLLVILLFILPMQIFAQLIYFPITEQNYNKKHKLYFMDNNEVLWKVKLKKDIVPLFKELPYNERRYYTHVYDKVTPKEYTITDEYLYFPNDKSLLIIDRKGKLVLNLIEERVQLFDSTEYGEFKISTPGGECEGNPNRGNILEFCGDFLFYITGKKVICMKKENFQIIQEFNFKDFRNRAEHPFVEYNFEAIEFKVQIKGKKK